MKREKTIDPNIFWVPSGYYYRKGDLEVPTGIKDRSAIKAAIEVKHAIEAALNTFGASSIKIKASAVWPRYIAHREKQLKQKHIRESTLKEINNLWDKYLSQTFSRMKLIDIDEVAWNKYVERARVNDLSNHRKVLIGFLSWNKQCGNLKQLPQFKIPKVIRRKRQILPIEDIKTLLSHAETKLRLYILLYLLAMRNSEILRLRWEDVDFDKGSIRIRAETSKTNEGRSIAFNQHVRYSLLVWQRECKVKSPFIFPRRGSPHQPMVLTGIAKSWVTCMTKSGFPRGKYTPHDLRATFEFWSHQRADFTDTQREKFAGAKIDVQKDIYVQFGYLETKGLENAVPLESIIVTGKTRGN